MKKLLLGFGALCAAFSLTACGKKDDDNKAANYKLGMGIVVSLESSKTGLAQVDATVATVVLDANGKIVECRLDAVQNKATIADGAATAPTTFKSKMELGSDYGMGGKPYSPDNNGDGKVLEWDAQAKAFEAYVEGMTAAQVNAIETKKVTDESLSSFGYDIAADEALLNAGCTIQITDFIKAVYAACTDEQTTTFKTAKSFTLGVAATSFVDGNTAATADAEGSIKMYTDFAASAVVNGKIVASLNDAIQPVVKFNTANEITAKTYTNTKRGLKDGYGMGGKPYSPDNNGDGKVEEWYVQSLAFSNYVVGMTADEVANIETKKVTDESLSSFGYDIAADEALLNAGCTIQITAIKAVVAKSVNNAR